MPALYFNCGSVPKKNALSLIKKNNTCRMFDHPLSQNTHKWIDIQHVP